MALTGRWIKLGRLLMLAWLAFYLYPIEVILTGAFPFHDKAAALIPLLGSGLVWAWFWIRIVGGPDGRFRVVALALSALFLGWFTLMTPPQYGTLVVMVAVIAGAAFSWRVAVPLVIVSALGAGILDILRGTDAPAGFGDCSEFLHLPGAFILYAQEESICQPAKKAGASGR